MARLPADEELDDEDQNDTTFLNADDLEEHLELDARMNRWRISRWLVAGLKLYLATVFASTFAGTMIVTPGPWWFRGAFSFGILMAWLYCCRKIIRVARNDAPRDETEAASRGAWTWQANQFNNWLGLIAIVIGTTAMVIIILPIFAKVFGWKEWLLILGVMLPLCLVMVTEIMDEIHRWKV